MSGLRTRNTSGSNLSDLVGKGRELLPSELPTARDILQLGIYLKETDPRGPSKYPVSELINEIYIQTHLQWMKANHLFAFPVMITEKAAKNKLKDLWTLATSLATNKNKTLTKKFKRTSFVDKLDKLFDLLHCHCPLDKCTCKRETKIPASDLEFIIAQREKVGSKGKLVIGATDSKETKRQIKLIEKKKKQLEQENKRKQKLTVEAEQSEFQKFEETCNDVENDEDAKDSLTEQNVIEPGETFNNVENDENAKDSSTEQNVIEPERKRIKYNTLKFRNLALASLRHGTGLREAAEIATCTLIDVDFVTKEDTTNVIDHNKLRRAQTEVMEKISEAKEEDLKKNGLDNVLFDGRIDKTKVFFEAEGSDAQYPGVIKEEHYSVCDSKGHFLFHFTPDESTKDMPHSKILATRIYEWLKVRGFDKTIQAIGGDSTSVNTGWKGGAMAHLEKLLGRKLVWLVCDLHTNELPLRHLIIDVDGKTLSNNKWSGPLGNMLDDATDMEIESKIKIVECIPLPTIPPEVVKDLSTDQYYAYLIHEAIRTGKISARLASLEIGPVNHSRWLTTANRFLRIWCSKHRLKGKNLANLQQIIEYIMRVYLPNWFNTKIKHHWIQGPNHVLFQLQTTRSLSLETQEMLRDHIQRSAWYSHSESILQSMLCSEQEEERRWGVNRIISLREGGEDRTGNNQQRSRRTSELNFQATSLRELIDWDKENVHEPPLTCHLTTADLRHFYTTPMEVPSWSTHTQAVERIVKMVTEACGTVYGEERREGLIKSQQLSRELMSRNRSKQDVVKLTQFRLPGLK